LHCVAAGEDKVADGRLRLVEDLQPATRNWKLFPVNICVFSSSSDIIEPHFFKAATELGSEIARRGDTLVWGGCKVGLMGAVAEGAHDAGGKVVGVIPTFMQRRALAYEAADEMIATETMRERKAEMESRADAFIALPGGFGTLEEMLEIITLKQLQQHTKPVIFLDVDGFWAPLASLFDHILQLKFAKPVYRELYAFLPTVPRVFEYLDSYEAPVIASKWFDTRNL
jgi:cytokinin riboside 5'-monophosphate phosphoribohydrolase